MKGPGWGPWHVPWRRSTKLGCAGAAGAASLPRGLGARAPPPLSLIILFAQLVNARPLPRALSSASLGSWAPSRGLPPGVPPQGPGAPEASPAVGRPRPFRPQHPSFWGHWAFSYPGAESTARGGAAQGGTVRPLFPLEAFLDRWAHPVIFPPRDLYVFI